MASCETRSCQLPGGIATAANRAVLFEGCVITSTGRPQGGFTLGTFEVMGRDGFAGQAFLVDLKNETMVGWLNGKLIVTIPEIIAVLNLIAVAVVTNSQLRVSQNVAILALPAP
ncbi:hypothetical protein [Roseobacter sp.]|uniref:S-methyl thiohydantoin desulfurase domain-containing protein n=1 Tax=Roseobacter sp. TaxID=1907202 RepID=UPI00385D757E